MRHQTVDQAPNNFGAQEKDHFGALISVLGPRPFKEPKTKTKTKSREEKVNGRSDFE